MIQRKKIFSLILLFTFFGCAQPQSTLPVYDEQLSLEEQKIQSQLFAESWLNAYLDFSEIEDDVINDNSGNGVLGIFISDYGIKYNDDLEPTVLAGIHKVKKETSDKGKAF